ncbi:hypothetical protein [Halarcobacter bivalviorum]|uniref:DUF5666 domain-containing protein n=1 Tax=Halarcobacter bivalviorum TaxID=663364 RepID=A0AAX2A530_9BACT|nr:hypothetical protein [Halarcobacter bivalviorum]AXH12860.1 hypothetical protein ABIV_1871 [Halarcobacter bivalviorum]RXK09015.1 hypothetical protein CRV05_12110 [Halarcobacter bivalviorum]
MIKKLTIACVGTLLTVNTLLAADKLHTGKILEIKDSGAYVYIKIKKEKEDIWAAIPKTDVKVGDNVTLKESTWMKNFESKTLGRTFDKVLFAEIDGQKKAIHGVDNIHGIHGQAMKKPNPEFGKITTSNEKAIQTNIEAIQKNKEKYKNKNVTLEGEVVEVSNKVMGNTWIKIKNNNDAMIFRSMNEDEKVKIGDKIKVTGTINTDVDYGYGFKYNVIGVNGKVEKL